jgi:hypothetical protein
LRIAVVAPRRLLGTLTLLWAIGAGAASPGTGGNPAPAAVAAPTSAVMPSIEILDKQTNLAGTCGGKAFDINTFINVDTQASADVRLSAPTFPTLEQFTDETGSNIGPYSGIYPTFNIQAFGGGLAPNTPIRITINTYSGHALAGSLTYSSSIQFDCTTGAILDLVAKGPNDTVTIPTLSDAAIAATVLLLMLTGILALRGQAAGSRRGRP